MRQQLYIGLMSGTSLDGVDAVLVDMSGAIPELLSSHFIPYGNEIRTELLALHTPRENELHHSLLIANRLARLYAQTVNQLLDHCGRLPREITAIGCHGQTIRHRPEHGYTVQIGNAALLAELSGIDVVSDFRSRDIAAGGQGAPLVPAFHDRVFRHPALSRVILNIGGISNITDLSPGRPTSGFDCGPGNLLMDAWCEHHLGEHYDRDGAWAAGGRVLPELLDKMLAEAYFTLPPPKSSGRDLFNLAWLGSKLHGDESPRDVQTTLLELTARSIVQDMHRYCTGTQEVYLCGGGAHNLALRGRLAELLPDCRIDTTDALGVPGDDLEAIAFAWLAQRAISGKTGNLPEVTGAAHPCVLGAIHRA